MKQRTRNCNTFLGFVVALGTLIVAAGAPASAESLAPAEHIRQSLHVIITHPDADPRIYTAKCGPPYRLTWSGDHQGPWWVCEFLQSNSVRLIECEADGVEADVATLTIHTLGERYADGENRVETITLDRGFPCHREAWDRLLAGLLPPADSQDELDPGTYHGELFVDGERVAAGIGLRYSPGNWALSVRSGDALPDHDQRLLTRHSDYALLRFDVASGTPLAHLQWPSGTQFDELGADHLCELLCGSASADVRFTRIGNSFAVSVTKMPSGSFHCRESGYQD